VRARSDGVREVRGILGAVMFALLLVGLLFAGAPPAFAAGGALVGAVAFAFFVVR